MTVSDAELTTFAASHDIISLGAAADEQRRRLHGTRTTFVRVAEVTATPGDPNPIPPAAGEVRIVGVPATLAAAARRVAEVVDAAGRVPVSAYSLDDLEALAGRERVTLRDLPRSCNVRVWSSLPPRHSTGFAMHGWPSKR
jgi:hypothetical protein